ncbi:hypothetical protein I6G56_21940 [Burkholderia humptydooensis]|uniref:Uncharacterized protein n=2 Tax=Burkholderia humptydooensis TaxID=430531 RepID=A0A7U4P9X7_9BURK|nr:MULTISPECIES: hypothetical protein [Burkholderia]ALX45642.1 hypothetical protein AQ610_24670 [Burkholderia humptydooensis]EIP86596.1 hypothetical protein A33K_16199 [Burkholderia humptydooensis MSMB43]QPS47131.1 hypothetical protein I6G56_21940 [Burkholderia humptydooensis]
MPATTDLHAAPARAAGRREIFLNRNESPFGPFDEAEAAAARALAEVGRYQFPLVERLREAVAAAHDVPTGRVSLYRARIARCITRRSRTGPCAAYRFARTARTTLPRCARRRRAD